jgi:hypothetical protein
VCALKQDAFSFGFFQVLSGISPVVLGDPQGCPRQLLFQKFEEVVQIIALKWFGGAPHYNQVAPLNITTFAGSNGYIVGSGRAIVVLPNNTSIFIEEAFLYPGAVRTLLTFKDIRRSGYNITTACENGAEYLHMTTSNECETKVVEKALGTSGLYYTKIKPHQSRIYCDVNYI